MMKGLRMARPRRFASDQLTAFPAETGDRKFGSGAGFFPPPPPALTASHAESVKSSRGSARQNSTCSMRFCRGARSRHPSDFANDVGAGEFSGREEIELEDVSDIDVIDHD